MLIFLKKTRLSQEQAKKNYAIKNRFYPSGGVPAFVAIDASDNYIDKKIGYRFNHPEIHIAFLKSIIKR